MNWFTALIISTYIGICEVRAPNVSACDGRWSLALGVLVPSPISPVMPALGRLVGRTRRQDEPGPKA
jgi:hypothetical protein